MAYSLWELRFWPRSVLLDSETRDTGMVSRKIDFDRLLHAGAKSALLRQFFIKIAIRSPSQIEPAALDFEGMELK